MTHDLRDRIAAVQQAHHLRMDFNHPAYGNCRCGFRTGFQERDGEDDFDLPWWELHAKHVADAVIAALKLHVVTVGDFQTVIKGSYPKPLEES
jgi:hypothetical protein